jgi:hypothetical protein
MHCFMRVSLIIAGNQVIIFGAGVFESSPL